MMDRKLVNISLTLIVVFASFLLLVWVGGSVLNIERLQTGERPLLRFVFVAVGLMDKYEAYPATSKDPHIYNPRWPAVILFLLGLAVFLYIGRRLALRGGASRRRGNLPAFAVSRVAQAGVDVFAREVGKILKDLFLGHARSKVFQ